VGSRSTNITSTCVTGFLPSSGVEYVSGLFTILATHTFFFLSLAESEEGKTLEFISRQCGVSADTIRGHYWRWIHDGDRGELGLPKHGSVFVPVALETGH